MVNCYSVYKVILEDRRDCCFDRMKDVTIRIGDNNASSTPNDSNPLCYHLTKVPASPTSQFPCSNVMHGRFVVARKITNGLWHINEVRIFIA